MSVKTTSARQPRRRRNAGSIGIKPSEAKGQWSTWANLTHSATAGEERTPGYRQSIRQAYYPSHRGVRAGRAKTSGSAAFVESTDNGPKEKPAISSERLKRLVGSYEFFSSTEPSLEEAVVEMVGCTLTLRITADSRTLTPITSDDARVVTKINVQSFKILGQPGTHVHFFMSGEKVRGLYYEEKRAENEEGVVAIATPTFLGFPR